MKCWKCPYTHKIERRYGVTVHCNLEPTEMDITYHVHRKTNNILCPFINEHTRYSSINYDKYVDENVEEWIDEYRDQVNKEKIKQEF